MLFADLHQKQDTELDVLLHNASFLNLYLQCFSLKNLKLQPPTPDDGVPLREAISECVAWEPLATYRQLIEFWRSVGEPEVIRSFEHFREIRLAPEFIAASLRENPLAGKLVSDLKVSWDDEILPAVSRAFSTGQLHAWGRTPTGAAPLERIPDKYWQDIYLLDLEQSSVAFGARGTVYTDVHSFKAADSPDLYASLVDFSLVDAFCNVAVKPLTYPFCEDGRVLEWRPFSVFNADDTRSFDRPVFPVTFETWTHNRQWREQYLSGSGHNLDWSTFSNHVRDASTMLLNLLRQGRLVACGTSVDEPSIELPIPQGMWSRPDVFVDVQYNRLVRLSKSARPDVSHGFVVSHENIGLITPEEAASRLQSSVSTHTFAVPQNAVTPDTPKTKNRVGRPEKWNWTKAHDELLLKANTPDGLPETKERLIEFVIDCLTDEKGEAPARSTVQDWLNKSYPKTLNSLKQE